MSDLSDANTSHEPYALSLISQFLRILRHVKQLKISTLYTFCQLAMKHACCMLTVTISEAWPIVPSLESIVTGITYHFMLAGRIHQCSITVPFIMQAGKCSSYQQAAVMHCAYSITARTTV